MCVCVFFFFCFVYFLSLLFFSFKRSEDFAKGPLERRSDFQVVFLACLTLFFCLNSFLTAFCEKDFPATRTSSKRLNPVCKCAAHVDWMWCLERCLKVPALCWLLSNLWSYMLLKWFKSENRFGCRTQLVREVGIREERIGVAHPLNG